MRIRGYEAQTSSLSVSVFLGCSCYWSCVGGWHAGRRVIAMVQTGRQSAVTFSQAITIWRRWVERWRLLDKVVPLELVMPISIRGESQGKSSWVHVQYLCQRMIKNNNEHTESSQHTCARMCSIFKSSREITPAQFFISRNPAQQIAFLRLLDAEIEGNNNNWVTQILRKRWHLHTKTPFQNFIWKLEFFSPSFPPSSETNGHF